MNVQDLYTKPSEKMNVAYWVNEYNMGNNQIILREQETMPEIYSIKKIYIIVYMGKIAMQLADQEEIIYSPCNVIDVPSMTRMKIKNISSEETAILVMKL